MKHIIISGASRGIGKAIALELASKDTALSISCKNSTALLSETSDLIKAKGSSCMTFAGDMADYKTTERFIKESQDKFGPCDILINNAGISLVGLFQDMSREDWDRIMDTNVGSVFNTCHAVLPNMISNKAGKIINISSVWGNVGASCEVAYSASKGAINAMTRALAKELAISNIQVNAISCGAIDTSMNDNLSQEEKAILCGEIPAGRFGQPSEVAKLVSQIIQAPSYLNGQIISLDGAWI